MRCAGWPMSTSGAIRSRCGLTLRRFSEGDFQAIEARPDYTAEMELLEGHPPAGLAWTLTQGDTPLMIGGFDNLGQGRWSAWTYGQSLSPRAWSLVRRAFHLMAFEVGARRVEACIRTVGPHYSGASRFAISLGMLPEGVMRAWGADGTDYELFARIYP